MGVHTKEVLKHGKNKSMKSTSWHFGDMFYLVTISRLATGGQGWVVHLGRVRVQLLGRSQPKEDHMTIVAPPTSEQVIGAVQIVQDTKHPKALIKPNNYY